MTPNLIDTSSIYKLNGKALDSDTYTTPQILKEIKRQKGLKVGIELKSTNNYRFNSDVEKEIKEISRGVNNSGLRDVLSEEDISLVVESIEQAKEGKFVVLYTEDKLLRKTMEKALDGPFEKYKDYIAVKSILEA